MESTKITLDCNCYCRTELVIERIDFNDESPEYDIYYKVQAEDTGIFRHLTNKIKLAYNVFKNGYHIPNGVVVYKYDLKRLKLELNKLINEGGEDNV